MSSAFLIVERPLIPISLARRTRSCLLQSSYELSLAALRPTWLRECAAPRSRSGPTSPCSRPGHEASGRLLLVFDLALGI